MQRFVLHNNWMSRTAQVWVSTLFYVLHIIRFYTLFCRASSCSASYHFSQQLTTSAWQRDSIHLRRNGRKCWTHHLGNPSFYIADSGSLLLLCPSPNSHPFPQCCFPEPSTTFLLCPPGVGLPLPTKPPSSLQLLTYWIWTCTDICISFLAGFSTSKPWSCLNLKSMPLHCHSDGISWYISQGSYKNSLKDGELFLHLRSFKLDEIYQT